MVSQNRPVQNLIHLVGGAALIAFAAQLSLNLPGSPVPQTGQTLAVLLVGILLGPINGSFATALYVVSGLMGLPVFAGGGSGWHHLVGPTGGYLVGFIIGAAFAGWWSRHQKWRTLTTAFAGMVMAHLIILGFGWSRLSALLGPAEAFVKGVLPFLSGAVVKTMIAAVVVQLRRFYLGAKRS